ncbi:MAG: redoxin domain-containing protein [Chloroflexi bacterium]|nr:redoxin domain-containing protein [Chloroflexota bacterium]
MKLQIGQHAPDFTLPSHLDEDVTLSSFRGKTVVMAFFPRAWTPVCSGQIPSYQVFLPKYEALNVQMLGLSIDHVPCLKAWADNMGGITYPLLSDFWPHGALAEQYGVLRTEGFTERAIFIIDKEGIIRFIDIHDIDDEPSNDLLLKELHKIIPENFKQAGLGQEENDGLPHGGIVMYCTRWCPDCRKARVWLKENNLPYVEVDITTNLTAARQVRSWGNGLQITPTFDIDGTIVLDFDEDKLSEILLN